MSAKALSSALACGDGQAPPCRCRSAGAARRGSRCGLSERCRCRRTARPSRRSPFSRMNSARHRRGRIAAGIRGKAGGGALDVGAGLEAVRAAGREDVERRRAQLVRVESDRSRRRSTSRSGRRHRLSAARAGRRAAGRRGIGCTSRGAARPRAAGRARRRAGAGVMPDGRLPAKQVGAGDRPR